MAKDTVLNVYRPHVSPYQNQKFKEWEKKSLEQIEGIRYLNTLEEGEGRGVGRGEGGGGGAAAAAAERGGG